MYVAHHFTLLRLNPMLYDYGIYWETCMYIAHHLVLLRLNSLDLSVDREGWWFEHSCHGCGFDYQRVLKAFPGPGYLRSKDGVVWLWHLLVYIYVCVCVCVRGLLHRSGQFSPIHLITFLNIFKRWFRKEWTSMSGADPQIFKRRGEGGIREGGGTLYVGHHGWLTKKF